MFIPAAFVFNVRAQNISTTPPCNLIQKWRKAKGLPMNPNAYGVLTDGADYSYLDGRPTPYGVRQKARLLKQKEISDRIMELTNEIDFAVERHQRVIEEESMRKRNILASKLKPKGAALLKKS